MNIEKHSILGLVLTAAMVGAQPPERQENGNSKSAAERFVARMMTFDKNADGKLTKDEITDARLLRLFERADANHDGIVTKEELLALFAKEPQGRGFGGGGPGGFGGPGGGGGPGGFGPRFGGPPRPGQVLPEFMQSQLDLTADQKKELAELQKQVDTRLAKILTADQNRQLKTMARPGPGGFGPPGGGGRPPEDGPGREGGTPPPDGF
jgi:hypothetical protein